MRLIDAERLCENCKDFPQCKGEFKAECAVYVEVAAQPTIDPASLRPKGEWISIEDRLPAYGQHVIVYTGRMMMAEVSTTYFWNEAYDAWQPVSHWMPLPEPPNCGADMRGNPHDS